MVGKYKVITLCGSTRFKDADWFRSGVKAALKAPAAINQQKFAFGVKGGEPVAKVKGIIASTKIDLGIVSYHFKIGSGRKIFVF